MKRLYFLILLLCGLLLAGTVHSESRNLQRTSSGGKKIALVIGNGNYQHTSTLQKLANPPHDAEDIAAALRGFDFEVIERENLTRKDMKIIINEFSLKIGNSDAALFYYAGHGLQVKGQNYLVPIDAAIELNSTDADLQDESINVNLILDNMDDAKSKVNIVMLDACRAPLKEGKFRSAASRGLAAIGSPPKGTVIVYATDPGNTAADGTGRNGLFTSGLLKAFKGGDLSLRGVLVRTSKEVDRGSDHQQTPYINGPAILQEEFHFGQGTQVASLEPVPVTDYVPTHVKNRSEVEQDSWDSVKDSNSVEAIKEYLKQYPKGLFASQAKILIAKLKRSPSNPTETAEPTPVSPASRDDGEAALWTEVQKGNSKDDYEAYLAQYPKGKYIALAKARIKKLQDEAAAEAERKEQEAWEAADKSGSEDSYQGYVKSYPSGRYASLAQVRMRRLQTELAARQEAERQRQQAEQQRKEAEAAAERQRQQAEAERKKRELPKGFVSQGGLTWMPVTFYKNWSDANAYCNNTAINGQNGWRLPTKEELSALYSSRAMNVQGWTLGNTWSSTPDGSGKHYNVGLYDGNVGSGSDTLNSYVSCVH